MSQSDERGQSEVVVNELSHCARGTSEGESSVIVGFGFVLPPRDLIIGSSCGCEAGCSECESCGLLSSSHGRVDSGEASWSLATVGVAGVGRMCALAIRCTPLFSSKLA